MAKRSRPLSYKSKLSLALAAFLPASLAGMMAYTGGLGNVANAASAGSPFYAPVGCAMAHCDVAMSDNVNTTGPAGLVTSLWHDTSVLGSDYGLGCSSNTHVVACSFKQDWFHWESLKVYSATGVKVWSSTLLDSTADDSAPMVDSNGGVIAADRNRLAHFDPSGKVLWQTKTAGGIPISPTVTANSAVVLATLNGPVSAYDAASGAILAQLRLNDTVTINGKPVSGYFDTVNTPTINGNRIYISTQFHSNTRTTAPYGRLYALDMNRSTTGSDLSVAWHYDFKAPSGASPLMIVNNGIPTIYFDGDGTSGTATTSKPYFFAVQDMGDHPQLAWKYGPMKFGPQASAAQDPRGGLWVFAPFYPDLIRLDQSTGTVLQDINVDNLVNQPGIHAPTSAMTISGSASKPVMTISATPLLNQSSYVLSIDLNASELLWDYRVDQGKGAAGVGYGQWPIVNRADGRPEVVFTTKSNGVWALGAQ